MARMRKAARARISHNAISSSLYRSWRGRSYIGSGRIYWCDTVQVEGPRQSYSHFAKAVVCTGARASAPPTPG